MAQEEREPVASGQPPDEAPDETSGPPAQIERVLRPVIESRVLAGMGYLCAAAAPYLLFVPMVSLLVPRIRKSDYMRYHAWNALLLGLVVTATKAVLMVAAVPVALSGAACTDAVCNVLSMIGVVLLPTAAAIYGAQLGYEAAKRRAARIPVLSRWAESLAGPPTQQTNAAPACPSETEGGPPPP